MVEGLRFSVASEELVAHCICRSKYHQQRSLEKKDMLPSLRQSLESLKSTATGSKSNYHLDPASAIEQLETDIRDHEAKIGRFAFMASHFFEDTYKLAFADLIELEFIRGRG